MPAKTSTRRNSQLSFRAAGAVPSTVNETDRTVEASLSTVTPVTEFDYDRWEWVPRVLVPEGIEIPRSKQVPLIDSHYPRTTSNQLGSVRAISPDGDSVKGTLVFSSVHEDAFTKVREGHATDVSVGFQVVKQEYIPEGKSRKIRGREFSGPMNVATKWRLLELSLTPIGADHEAKIRGFDPTQLPSQEFAMNEALRKLLVDRGMPSELDDDAAQQWLLDNRSKLADQQEDKPVRGHDGGNLTEDQVRKWIVSGLAEAEKERSAKTAEFRGQVDSLVEVSGLPADAGSRFYGMGSIEEVRKAIIAERAKNSESSESPLAPITFGAAQRDKHRGAVHTALVYRTFRDCQFLNEGLVETGQAAERREAVVKRLFPEDRRSKDHEQFRHASLYDLACECLRMDGVDIRGLTRDEVAQVALGFGDQIGIRTDSGYHVTGSFPFVTQDVVNKSMMLGYLEAPQTWRGPMSQGQSASDFKKIHRVQIGAVPNLPVWDDQSDPSQASMADAEETYGIECRSLALSFSYKLLVNDDRGVIGRQPMKLGDSAARTVNKFAWSLITSNPTMRDSVALFAAATGARKRTNLTIGAGVPSATTIQTLTNLMMQMRGENTPEGNESDDILALMPTYIVGPSALRTTILQVVRSIADPNGTHSGVVNVNNDLVPVIEPLLDANSTTAWYLFASPQRVETAEVTFLQGQETPRVRTIMDPKRLSQEHIILQTFGGKALDHRGVQKHAGA